MKVTSVEPLSDYGLYRATVLVPEPTGWRFWQTKTRVKTLVGNGWGWYDSEDGSAITDKDSLSKLDAAVRVIQIGNLLKEQKPNLKPVN